MTRRVNKTTKKTEAEKKQAAAIFEKVSAVAQRKAANSDESCDEKPDSKKRKTQADILIELAQAADLFRAPDGTGYADLDINGHRETWPIRNKGFKRWLSRRFFEATKGAPNSEAMNSALNILEAKAHYDASERSVHTRIAAHD